MSLSVKGFLIVATFNSIAAHFLYPIVKCPTAQPMCDKYSPGSNYCQDSPDTSCYLSGWPACCSLGGGVNCPKSQPPCETNDEHVVVENASVPEDDTVPESSEDLLDAAEGPVILADLDRRNRDQPGYCYGRTDYVCYR